MYLSLALLCDALLHPSQMKVYQNRPHFTYDFSLKVSLGVKLIGKTANAAVGKKQFDVAAITICCCRWTNV